ncbi:hypothetical protein TNCV_2160261 [Trichonephila clavipes]|nr:hypothetical protein TNCV_2160261 [Trichonephila clavipes]
MPPVRRNQIEVHEIHHGKGLDVVTGLFPTPQFRHGTGGKGNILQSPALVVSAATADKTFGPTYLTSTYSVCTRKVFGGIGYRIQVFRSGVRCSNHFANLGTAKCMN